MSDEAEVFYDQLKNAFPKMYVSDDTYVGKGWWNIIWSLSTAIQNHIDWHNSRPPEYREEGWQVVEQVVVLQIKEKFGELRFYYNGGDDKIYGMVVMAEMWASHTCERCGDPGKLRAGGWMKTLCDKHEAERKAAMRERMGEVMETDNWIEP